MGKLLTVTQAAERLGVHYQTLRKWADKGLVPVVRLPSGYRRFDPDAIDRVRVKMGLLAVEDHYRIHTETAEITEDQVKGVADAIRTRSGEDAVS